VRITDQDWTRLETHGHTHGLTVRRIYPQSAHEIFIAVRHPDDARMLTITIDDQAAADVLRRVRKLPRTRGIGMQFAKPGNQYGQFCVILTDPTRREVFNPLVSDIAATAQAEANATRAILAAIDRFDHWRNMLQNLVESGLSLESRRGLYGELSLLAGYLLPFLAADEAVRSWTGPTGAHQDFQLPQSAIEVKTSSGKEPQAIVISSERELDKTGTGQLLLGHFSLDERRGGSGESLNAIIDRTRDLITSPAARELFDSLLVRAGYLADQRRLYDEPRYTIRKKRFWNVIGDFPRITEADLRPGVGGCEYRISIVGLDEYLVPDEDLPSVFMENSAT
jgi:hypothetical protein